MKIRYLYGSGVQLPDGRVFFADQVYEVSDEDGEELCRDGHFEEVGEDELLTNEISAVQPMSAGEFEMPKLKEGDE